MYSLWRSTYWVVKHRVRDIHWSFLWLSFENENAERLDFVHKSIKCTLYQNVEAQWPIGYGVGLRIKRSSVRIRPWPLRWVLGQGSLLPLSQGEAFTLASISYLAILVKYILAKKKKKKKKKHQVYLISKQHSLHGGFSQGHRSNTTIAYFTSSSLVFHRNGWTLSRTFSLGEGKGSLAETSCKSKLEPVTCVVVVFEHFRQFKQISYPLETVILQIFIEVLFSVLSVVKGFTEIKKTPPIFKFWFWPEHQHLKFDHHTRKFWISNCWQTLKIRMAGRYTYTPWLLATEILTHRKFNFGQIVGNRHWNYRNYNTEKL